MKKLILFIFTIYGFTVVAQVKTIKKPEYVIIANNEIITTQKVEELVEQGWVKSMNKGVTEEERNKLADKIGDKIGDREFIIRIDLLTEKEKIQRQNKIISESEAISEVKNRNNELKLNINDTANEFKVEMINGEKIKLSDLKGKVVPFKLLGNLVCSLFDGIC